MTAPPMGFRTFGDLPPGPGDEPVRSRDGGDNSGGGLAGPLPLAPGRLSGRSALIVLAFAGLLLLPALGGRLRVLTQHEVFAAQTAREMLATGDWVVPHFAGRPRLNKPPGMYYLIAGSMAVFQSRAEWVARLPAALAGVATALMVARLAGRWMGDFAGLVAGLMQASFAYVLMQARLAEADMPMCAAVVLAMSAFARAAVEPVDGRPPPPTAGRRAGLALLFGLGTGLAVVLKGPGGIFVPAGCALWVVATRRWRAARFLLHPLALLAAGVVAGAWFLAAYLRDPRILGVWRQETFGRIGGEFADADPWHIYFWAVPFLLLPWLPFAVRGGVEWWRGAAARDVTGGRHTVARLLCDHPRAAFLASWFAGGMTLLLFSQARHKHYAIPMLPPATLLAAAGFVSWLGEAKRDHPTGAGLRPARQAAAAAVILGLVAAGAAAGLAPAAKAASAGLALTVAAGVAITILARAAGRRRAALTACFGTALAGGLGAQVLVVPAYDDYKASANLARRADAVVPAGRPVYIVALREAHAAYYLDRPLVRVDRRPEVTAYFAAATGAGADAGAGHDRYVLCPESAVPLLAAAGEVTELDRVDHLRRTEKDPVVLVRLRTAGK